VQAQAIALVLFVFAGFVLIRASHFLYAIFLTGFVIILLNLDYPGGLLLAETRVFDTVAGGVLALAAAGILWLLQRRETDRARLAPAQ
jgi:uncharacterized membrane protein YccC